MRALDVLAGAAALPIVRERGLTPGVVDAMVAASGGPKWLVLSGLDRVLGPRFLARCAELPAIGASIGAWRLAALAQPDPVAAIARFERAYIDGQRYDRKPSPAEVSRVSARVLDALLAGGDRHVVDNPHLRVHVLADRCRGLVARETPWLQSLGLGLAAAGNLASRRTLGHHLERVVFGPGGEEGAGPFRGLSDLPTRYARLTVDALRPTLLASGSIPLVLEGVRIPGAPPGVYRDGGVVDYHPDLPLAPGPGIVLYPHFFPRVTPGWFDKKLPWRTARHLDRALLLAPSADFVASLPHGKVPDRTDFAAIPERERLDAWWRVVRASRALGDELGELLDGGGWADRVRPLPA